MVRYINVHIIIIIIINIQNYKYDLFFMGKLRLAVFDLYIQ